jgi:hypothetical protein
VNWVSLTFFQNKLVKISPPFSSSGTGCDSHNKYYFFDHWFHKLGIFLCFLLFLFLRVNIILKTKKKLVFFNMVSWIFLLLVLDVK